MPPARAASRSGERESAIPRKTPERLGSRCSAGENRNRDVDGGELACAIRKGSCHTRRRSAQEPIHADSYWRHLLAMTFGTATVAPGRRRLLPDHPWPAGIGNIGWRLLACQLGIRLNSYLTRFLDNFRELRSDLSGSCSASREAKPLMTAVGQHRTLPFLG